jgi:hypothetical protein
MSITEALAKSASQSRNLARKKLQQLGIDPDQDALTIMAQYTASTVPNKNDCDGANGAATMQQVNGLYYCLEGVAPYTVCVERPDSNALNPEMVCSDMQFTDAGININLDIDQLMDSEPSVLSASAKMIASAFSGFKFKSSEISRNIHKNNNSPLRTMVSMIRERSPQVKLSYNLAHAGVNNVGTNNDSFDDGFYVLDAGFDLDTLTNSIRNQTDVDLVVLSSLQQFYAALAERFDRIKSQNTDSNNNGNYYVPSKESLIKLKNLTEAIKSSSYKYIVTDVDENHSNADHLADNKMQSDIDDLLRLLSHHGYTEDANGNVTDLSNDSSHWPSGYNPNTVIAMNYGDFKGGMGSASNRAKNYKERSANYIASNSDDSNIPDPTLLNADSKYNEAIAPTFVAELVPCSVINRCVNVQAESKRAAELRGKRYLQNVFVE